MTATPARSSSTIDLASLLYLGAVWGAVWLFMRIAAPEVGPVWAAEVRVALAALILVVVAGRRTWRTARGRWLDFAFTGRHLLRDPVHADRLRDADAARSGIGALLNASTPLFTAIVGAVVIGQRLTGRVVVGLAFGVAAVVVVVGLSPLDMGPGTVLAVAAALGAALSYAFAGTFVRRRLQRRRRHRDRDRPAGLGLDHPAAVRRPVRRAGHAVGRAGPRRSSVSRSSRPRSRGPCTSGSSVGPRRRRPAP